MVVAGASSRPVDAASLTTLDAMLERLERGGGLLQRGRQRTLMLGLGARALGLEADLHRDRTMKTPAGLKTPVGLVTVGLTAAILLATTLLIATGTHGEIHDSAVRILLPAAK